MNNYSTQEIIAKCWYNLFYFTPSENAHWSVNVPQMIKTNWAQRQMWPCAGSALENSMAAPPPTAAEEGGTIIWQARNRSKTNCYNERRSRSSHGCIGWKVAPTLAHVFAWLEVLERVVAAWQNYTSFGSYLSLCRSVKFLAISMEASHRYEGRGIPECLRITKWITYRIFSNNTTQPPVQQQLHGSS